MFQRWEELLFLHWRWNPAEVQRTLPLGLTVDLADGSAWLGLTPLLLRNVRPRFIPAMPGVSEFLELNLRTYVFDAWGRPGVYFYSLDCNQPLVVEAARRLLHLRYEHSELDAAVDVDRGVTFKSRRRLPQARPDFFQYRIEPTGGRPAEPETLEFFLIERYRLFGDSGLSARLPTVHIAHEPYQLHRAEVEKFGVNAFVQAGFAVGSRPPDHVCGAKLLEVQVSMPTFAERN
jgi:uncharacterized protein YqjF (DUF2071 family)